MQISILSQLSFSVPSIKQQLIPISALWSLPGDVGKKCDVLGKSFISGEHPGGIGRAGRDIS